jgi:hypothetical protein
MDISSAPCAEKVNESMSKSLLSADGQNYIHLRIIGRRRSGCDVTAEPNATTRVLSMFLACGITLINYFDCKGDILDVHSWLMLYFMKHHIENHMRTGKLNPFYGSECNPLKSI